MGNKCCYKHSGGGGEAADSVLNEDFNQLNNRRQSKKKSNFIAAVGNKAGPSDDYGLGDDTSLPIDSK